MVLAPKRIRGKAFVASYSSATVADFHGVPCTDVLRHKRLKELGAERKQRARQFQEDSGDDANRTHFETQAM
jgi:hypothetical protein